jgi:hypothetical protein
MNKAVAESDSPTRSGHAAVSLERTSSSLLRKSTFPNYTDESFND